MITFLLADSKAKFNVADDMWIYEKSSSKLGGLISKSEQQIKYRPHTVSAEDLPVLMNIFDTVAMNKYNVYLRAFLDAKKIKPRF